MPIEDNVVYVCKEPLVENRKLTVRTYRITNRKEKLYYLMAQYVGYYRGNSWTVALYPKYNPHAHEQKNAKKHVISDRLIQPKIFLD